MLIIFFHDYSLETNGISYYELQVRTKSRDSQSSDSAPTPIPPAVLRGVASRVPRGPGPAMNQPPAGYRGQRPQPYQQHQQVIEHDENLSDKEIFPTGNRHDPQTTQVKIYLTFYSYFVLIFLKVFTQL